ncbi:MAG: hypothetical protein GPJ54_03740 [Candidatus Heimdallarchaeota archaeon]|nr:hypothetical protein [Candidatus Heimdallarchaeota archaeon]
MIDLFIKIVSAIILLGFAGFLLFQSRQQYLQNEKYDKLRLVITAIIFVHLFITQANLRFTDVTAIIFLTFFLLSSRIVLQTLTTMNEMRGDEAIVNEGQAGEIKSKYQEQQVISSLVNSKNI